MNPVFVAKDGKIMWAVGESAMYRAIGEDQLAAGGEMGGYVLDRLQK